MYRAAWRYTGQVARSSTEAPAPSTRMQVYDRITHALPLDEIDGGRDLMNERESIRSIVLY